MLDWVPAHFPRDDWALARFDGTALYEHADPRRGAHPDWGTLVFNLGRNEVRNFLIANALFWLREYHADGLRVDAVASMLYRDYSRAPGEWVPNEYGGREDLEAVAFLRELNEVALRARAGHRSPSPRSRPRWPGVSRPTYLGGLGFGFKWNMGWMHDTLDYFAPRPDPPPLPPQRADLQPALRLQRELHPAALPRRGRARQGLAAREDARRPLAAVRQPAGALRLHVGPPRQEAPLHGRRVRPGGASGATSARSTGTCSSSPSTPASRRSCATSTASTAPSRRCGERDYDPAGFRWLEADDAAANVLAFMPLRRGGRAARLRRQLLAGRARGLPRRPAARRALARGCSTPTQPRYGGAGVGNAGWLLADELAWNDQSHSWH